MLVFAVVYGMGLGMSTIVRGAGTAEILGTQGYGAIAGSLSLASKFAMAASPVSLALLWQSSGSYQPVLWSLFAVSLMGLAGFWQASMQQDQT
jgi:MFS-type transporter involved in bile tolerance (Atg22 family)